MNRNINESLSLAKRLVDAQKFTNLIVVGDFNHSDIRWSDIGGSCIGNGRQASLEFLDMLSDSYLSQFVHEPTFGNNTLDLAISDNPLAIFNVYVCLPLGSTYKMKLHSMLFLKFILKDVPPITINPSNFYLFKKGNYNEINKALKQMNWYELFENKDVDECYSLFNNKYHISL